LSVSKKQGSEKRSFSGSYFERSEKQGSARRAGSYIPIVAKAVAFGDRLTWFLRKKNSPFRIFNGVGRKAAYFLTGFN